MLTRMRLGALGVVTLLGPVLAAAAGEEPAPAAPAGAPPAGPAAPADAAPVAVPSGPAPSVERLVSTLAHDASYKVRLQAAVLLGRSGDARVADPLLDALDRDSHHTVRAACATALAGLGVARAAPGLLAHAGADPDPFVREESARALAKLDRAQAFDLVVRAYGSPYPPVRREVVRWLVVSPGPAVEPTLALALGDVAEVSAPARVAVAAMPPDDRLRFLGRVIEHREPAVRRGAVEALAADGTPEAAQLVVRVLERDIEEEDVRAAAREALRTLAPVLPVVQILREAAHGPERHTRARALRLLGTLGGAEGEKVLLAALADDDPYLRGVAVIALGELGDPAAVPALEKLMQDPQNERMGQLVANTLRELRSREEARGR